MRFILFPALLIAAAPAYSEICPEVENDLDRLACYDKEAGLTPTTTVIPATNGEWVVRSDKSEFKDTTDVFVTLLSENTLTCKSYGAPEKATLFLRCAENTTSIFISTDCHLASGVSGYGQVEYRFDEKPAGKRGFNASTDNSALGLWSGGKSIPFIKAMLDSERAIFRFTPYAQNKVTAKFNITGIEEVIAPLREECGW